MKIYVTYEGESLYDVAKHCNVQVDVLQQLNKHIKDPSYMKGNTHITIPSVMGIEGIVKDDQFLKNKGNVCAYVQDEPVHYKKLNITHWPSQDYTHPHPKNGTHAAEKFDDEPVYQPSQYQVPQHPPSYYLPKHYKQLQQKNTWKRYDHY